jgi:uncharacterized pyridoxal phosphate-containing UPF0001 family protein
MTNSIFTSFLQVKEKVRNTECRFGRSPGAVKLIAVSKAQNLEAIRSLIVSWISRLSLEKLQELNFGLDTLSMGM